MAGEERPPHPDAPKRDRPPDDNRDLWRLLGMGMQLALTVALFAALGWWLEDSLKWPAWSRTVVSIFGIAVALYHFVKDTQR